MTMKPYTILRDGKKNLGFTGALLVAELDSTYDEKKGTLISIYKIKGGKYILSAHQWTKGDEENDSNRAEVFETPEEMVEWLTKNSGGEFKSTSIKALKRAGEYDAVIRAAIAEKIG